MKEILSVSIGGAIGATCRYLLGKLLEFNALHQFPWSTLCVNLTGSFIIGIVFYYFKNSTQSNLLLYQFLAAGVLGGFTTYSTFSLDAFQLALRSQYGLLFIYIMLSLIGGITLSWLGFLTAKLIWA